MRVVVHCFCCHFAPAVIHSSPPLTFVPASFAILPPPFLGFFFVAGDPAPPCSSSLASTREDALMKMNLSLEFNVIESGRISKKRGSG